MPARREAELSLIEPLGGNTLERQWKQAIPTIPVYGEIECTKGGGRKNLTADEYRQAAFGLKKAGADGRLHSGRGRF